MVEASVSYCDHTSSLIIEIPEISVEKEICVVFPKSLSMAEQNITEHCFKILEKAQMDYNAKAKAMDVIDKMGKKAVASLMSMNLNPAVLGELCEILTA